ncbi:MAG: cellobiose phosphorylase [Candidatus Omnitrophota bacterium]
MNSSTKQIKIKYYLNQQGEFVIENYNYAKPFVNFFPGIAGRYGIPMWVFYVNRGQCISSFGTKDKDQAILEFFPANKAWQLVTSHGFRTFIKIKSNKKVIFYEPFHNGSSNLEYRITNLMRMDSAKLTIEEINFTLGIKTCVEYFNIPDDNFAGLSRMVTVENIGKTLRSIEIIDGLPQIIPFGEHQYFLKEMSRTIEAWMKVDNFDKGVPFYKLAVDPSDRPEVVHIDAGNFYLNYHFKKNRSEIIRPIVDPQVVFGPVTDFSYPYQFLAKYNYIYPRRQLTDNKTPSALLFLKFKLKPKEQKKFYSVIGQARNVKILNSSVDRITKFGYLENKLQRNVKLIADLKNEISTKSSSAAFDLYAGQSYLDNIMRGGYPEVLKSGAMFYLYARKHGDPERDYNRFQLDPTYLSQGNGNYRDANQNRRNDLWFNPLIKDENIIFFMNLIQSDGFNPLVIKSDKFLLKDNFDLIKLLKEIVEPDIIDKFKLFFKKPFTPGELIFFVELNKIQLKSSYDDFLTQILSSAQKLQDAEHGEGFWTDHWTYNLDLIDSFLGIYPEKFKELFFEKKVFSFYDNAEIVRPRNEKYVLYNGEPRQLHSVVMDSRKKELIAKRSHYPHDLRMQHGAGEIYYTTLIVKLVCLAVNKLASLDPFGVGIEMEANKPNWYDSLNGLPALFGSSTCETFELKRLLQVIKKALNCSGVDQIQVPEEIADFINQTSVLFSYDGFNYWDKSNNLKEDYRNKTCLGFSGNLNDLSVSKLLDFVDAGLEKVEAGLTKAFNKETGIYNSYFINTVVDYELIKGHMIKPKKFTQTPLPLFLEGQMHGLRLAQNSQQAIKLHQATKQSNLFDKKLKMYKVCASLFSMPEEIGRTRVFTPGWLENESIWLHMEYKYILELLKTGLIEEFYTEFKHVLIPFQDPKRYGRSILENSSFIASSAFSDQSLQGNGFVARLSGSTAEFLHIWLIMNAGSNPFTLDNQGKLKLEFKPNLAGWLFTKQGTYSFNFLSSILVTYYNQKKKDTFGKHAAKIVKQVIFENDKQIEINSTIIPSAIAENIRARKVSKIDIYLE